MLNSVFLRSYLCSILGRFSKVQNLLILGTDPNADWPLFPVFFYLVQLVGAHPTHMMSFRFLDLFYGLSSPCPPFAQFGWSVFWYFSDNENGNDNHNHFGYPSPMVAPTGIGSTPIYRCGREGGWHFVTPLVAATGTQPSYPMDRHGGRSPWGQPPRKPNVMECTPHHWGKGWLHARGAQPPVAPTIGGTPCTPTADGHLPHHTNHRTYYHTYDTHRTTQHNEQHHNHDFHLQQFHHLLFSSLSFLSPSSRVFFPSSPWPPRPPGSLPPSRRLGSPPGSSLLSEALAALMV